MIKAHSRLNSYMRAIEDFSAGRSTPRAFLDQCLAHIENDEKHIEAFVTLNSEAARAAADRATERWQNGKPLSLIDGMPIGIKDVIETKDMPTQMGSPYFKNWQSNRDSATVAALRQAGAVIIGKTVTTEFAATIAGPTRNPHDRARTPGGSSSGSAAGVAAGFMAGALGTQVVGSIVRPASFCGVWGFKPSVGALNRGGSHDYMSQSCAGVLAASREDAWAMAIAIARRVGGDPGKIGLQGPERAPPAVAPKALVFLETQGWQRAVPQARAALEAMLEKIKQAGVRIYSRADLPLVERVEVALHQALPLTRLINAWESLWPLNTYCHYHPELISDYLRDRLREAQNITADDYQKAVAERKAIRQLYHQLSEQAGACITLSAPDVAPLGLSSTGDPIFVVQGSFLGTPALNLPALTLNDLPLGVQMLGFTQHDAALFGYAAFVEDIIMSSKNV